MKRILTAILLTILISSCANSQDQEKRRLVGAPCAGGEAIFEYGDSLLTNNEINPDSPRGGSSGLLTFKNEDGLLVGKRDIILGKNIPGYE